MQNLLYVPAEKGLALAGVNRAARRRTHRPARAHIGSMLPAHAPERRGPRPHRNDTAGMHRSDAAGAPAGARKNGRRRATHERREQSGPSPLE